MNVSVPPLMKVPDRSVQDLLRQIVTVGESWVHHYDPESKQQSKEYRHKTSPSPKKFKVFSSARKVLLTIFWDSKGVVHTEFSEQGNTVNSTKYVSEHTGETESEVATGKE